MTEEVLNLLKETAFKAGELLRNHRAENYAVEEKTSNKDLVTQYDKVVQEYIIENLSKSAKNASFIAEESDVMGSLEDDCLFIIDPIDGTTNFIHGIPYYSISIAYYDNGSPVAGVVYSPRLGEMYCAETGKGAFLNGRRLHIGANRLENAIVTFGTSPYNNGTTEDTFSRIQQLYRKCQDIRRFGSAALDICHVASGAVDLYFEASLSIWDYIAAQIILKEAGGVLLDYEGNAIKPGTTKTSVIAGAEEIIRESGLT